MDTIREYASGLAHPSLRGDAGTKSVLACGMQLDPEEERKLREEWNKSKKWGASRSRERALATLVSTVVGTGAFLAAVGGEVVFLEQLSVRGFLVGLIGAVVLGGAVRAATMPRGQFD